MSTDGPDTDTDAGDLAERFPHVAKLEQALKEADIDIGDIPQRKGTTRRNLLAGSAGLLGLGGLLTGGSGTASAGDDQVGSIGTDNNRLDAEIEDLDLTDQSSVPAGPGSGQVRMYFRDGTPYYLPEGGSETQLGGGAGIFEDTNADGVYEQTTGDGIGTGSVNAEDLLGVAKLAKNYSGADGGEKVRNALDEATAESGRSVVIVGPNGPDTNGRWDVGADDLRLASDDTVLILNNCHVRLKDDTNRPVIELGDRSNNYENIHVIGWGEPHVDGNAGNQTLTTDGPDRLGILVYNIDTFSLQGFKLGPTNGWAISPQNSTDGDIGHITFAQDGSKGNQDGVTTVGPLDDITVHDLNGTTHDDFVGLNNHSDQGMAVGSGGAIRDLTFRNIRAHAPGAGQPLRVLNGDGLTMKDVLFENWTVVDGSTGGDGLVTIGQPSYLNTSPAPGDIDDLRFKEWTVPGNDGDHAFYIGLDTGHLDFEDITVRGTCEDVINQGSSFTTTRLSVQDVDVTAQQGGRGVVAPKGTVEYLHVEDVWKVDPTGNQNDTVFGLGGTVNGGLCADVYAEDTNSIWASGGAVSVRCSGLDWSNLATPFKVLPAGVKFEGGIPPHDVRDFGNVEGAEAYHDGSGTNTEGPAFNDGSGWISLVDGTAIT